MDDLPMTRKRAQKMAMSPEDALARCVFDASGDADGTSRKRFCQSA